DLGGAGRAFGVLHDHRELLDPRIARHLGDDDAGIAVGSGDTEGELAAAIVEEGGAARGADVGQLTLLDLV
ncbi:hypothetical protein DKX15_15835, partial [Enterococcus faecium]